MHLMMILPDVNLSVTDLISSQGCLVQDRPYISLSASEAMVAFLYMDQAKSHSFTPPAAIALQYTVDFRLGWMLEDRKHLQESINKGGKGLLWW